MSIQPQPTLTLHDLNRATLARQMLLQRSDVGVIEAIERLGALQAQYSPSPYIALWTRLHNFQLSELTDALLSRQVVKASLMRWTLHLASTHDYPFYTTAMADAHPLIRLSEVESAGVDIVDLHRKLLAYASQPRTFDELVAFANAETPNAPKRHQHGAWQWAQARGWLVHVPPSGTWRYFGKNSYQAAREWLGPQDEPSLEEANLHLVRRYLAAYGPATRQDVLAWSGIRRVSHVDHALKALGDNIVTFKNETGKTLYDLADSPRPGGDTPAPVRFLPKWDNILLANQDRTRILPAHYRKAVIRVNGDVLPTILVDGRVAGTWSIARVKDRATLLIEPLEPIGPAGIAELEREGDRLARFVEADAGIHEVRVAHPLHL